VLESHRGIVKTHISRGIKSYNTLSVLYRGRKNTILNTYIEIVRTSVLNGAVSNQIYC